MRITIRLGHYDIVEAIKNHAKRQLGIQYHNEVFDIILEPEIERYDEVLATLISDERTSSYLKTKTRAK